MPNYRSVDEIGKGYFARHPEEIDDFLSEIFEAYAQDDDSAALLSGLRLIARAKGVSNIAEQIGLTRQDLQKALSNKGNPRLENINAIMKAMGYHLTPSRVRSQLD